MKPKLMRLFGNWNFREDLPMHPDRQESVRGTTQESRRVSGRFLSDLFRALERHGIPTIELLGDLPIPVGDRGQVRGSVDWNDFSDFLCRLERKVGGPSGLENCGEMIGRLAPAGTLAGLAASPYSLYKAASRWTLRRALPGVEARLTRIDEGHLEIEARLAEGLRACPQILHLATGGARSLPRLIGLPDAVVSASISDREAHYRITLPPSKSLFARVRRLTRAILAARSTLYYLEAQQLELHALNEALQSAQEALAASERRFRTIMDTAVDVLCEIDAAGRIIYVSGSIRDLMGYSPEQVTLSHYRLWIDREQHERVEKSFDRLFSQPAGRSTRECVRLHTGHAGKVDAEVTARSYDTPDGARRIVCILRDMSAEAVSTMNRLGNQSATRSISAPRARSFSSTRS